MKNNDHAPLNRRGWSVAQEMEQTFADWVGELPFMAREEAHGPGSKDSATKLAVVGHGGKPWQKIGK